MNERWVQRRLILEPPLQLPWVTSHAMGAVARPHGDERLELLFSPRDALGRSHIARAWFHDLPGPVAEIEPEPVLGPGKVGAFDDSGTTASCLVASPGGLRLYYIGWNRGASVRFQTAIGCAESTDGRRFERVSEGPVIGRSMANPYIATSPWVLLDEGRWRMWYAAGVAWSDIGGRLEPSYNIRHAESVDGLEWECRDEVCIDFADEAEYAIARPCVIKDGALYRMWFSYRGERYRIGYAESDDGLSWQRQPHGPTLAPTGHGWEREMVEYPTVFDYRGARHLFYNGNGYGFTGIGHALLKRPRADRTLEQCRI